MRGEAAEKSSHHSRIAGEFGEAVLAYWLSLRGYEVCRVDHTGIDLLASIPKGNRRLGISVKHRTRSARFESDSVRFNVKDIPKIKAACKRWAAEPFLGVVVDRKGAIEAHLVRLATALNVNGQGKSGLHFKVDPRRVKRYRASPDYLGFTLRYEPAL